MSDRYCKSSDLLTGDTTIGTVNDPDKYVNIAADEMDGEIGFIYKLPLGPTPLAQHVKLILSNCNRLIASGRLILAYAGMSMDNPLHAYGASLLKQGLDILGRIRNGDIDLIGVDKIDAQATAGNAPKIINYDATSAVDDYYAWASGPCPVFADAPIWRPGS